MAKILIIEDDKFLLNAYRVKFTKLKYDLRLAQNGQEAIDVLPTFTPDIILLDLVMPVKDGFTVLMELKAHELYKHIPVIITSNLSQKEDADKALSLGAVDFLVKSDVSLDAIAEKVQAVIGQK